MKYFTKDYTDPRFQVIVVFATILMVMLTAFLIGAVLPGKVTPKFYWLTCTSFLVVFAIFNSLGGLAAKDLNQYWGKSMYSFGALAASAGFMAYLFSGLSIFDAGSYSWLYKVVFIVYLVFMSMIRFMKTIVEFAQKEEWNQPKFKNRNR